MKTRRKSSILLSFLFVAVIAICTFGLVGCGWVCDHETLTKHEVCAATCTTDGVLVEYWSCDECGAMFKDENKKDKIKKDEKADYIIPAAHSIEKVDAVAATCTTDGSKEYYHCNGCEKNFEEESAETEISDVATWKVIAAPGHNFVDGSDATHYFSICDTCDHVDNSTKVERVLNIKTEADLFAFATAVNGGRTFENETVNLLADITLTENWTPAGYVKGPVFKGTFDGKNHTISNMIVTFEDSIVEGAFEKSCAGFIGNSKNAIVKNLTIKDSSFTGSRYNAAFVGYAAATEIDNCHLVNSEIRANRIDNDNDGAKSGAFIGYINQNNTPSPLCKVTNCSARNTNIYAHRDAGQLIGCAINPTASILLNNNVIENVVVTCVAVGCDHTACDNVKNEPIGRV